jgi:hypothetical protein
VPKPIEAAKMSMPAQRPSGMSTAMQTGKDIAGAYSMGKSGLIGSAKTAADPEGTAGLIGGQGEFSGKNIFSKAKELFAADGGFIVPRHAYALGGNDEEDVTPYDVKDTMSGQDPMKEVLRSGSQKPQQLKAAQMSMGSGGQGGQSGIGQLASGLGAAKSLYGMGSGALSGLKELGAGFSSAGNAAGLDAVLGPGFFAENIGLGAGGASAAGSGLMGSIGSGLGSLFAEAGPFALLLKDGGRIPAYADGGLVPRQGYALQGATDVPADYSPEADMPSPNAQEAARYSEEDLDRAARDALALQMRRESGGDPQARAKTSSAAGLYQITDPTAKGLIQRNPGLGIQYDPSVKGFAATLPREQQEALGLALSKEHVRTLSDKGFEPTPQNVSANWFLGASGGPALLKAMQADPSMPATSIAGLDAIRANQTTFFKKDGSPRSVSEVYSMLNKTGGGAPVPPGLVGAGMQPAAPSGEGKKSIGDVVTSEGFIVPALGFLGSMLASDKRNLGQALGEGIMGGVGAYQSQRKMAAELPKIEAATKLELANVGRTDMMTRALKAGMLVPTWQPGVGLVVIDKENPYAGMTPVTDADGKPLPGNEKLVEEIQKSGSAPAGTPGAKPGAVPAVPVAPAAKTSDITQVIQKPVDATSWTPTTSVPKNYIPANQANITMRDPSTGGMTDAAKGAYDSGKAAVGELEAKARNTGPAMVQLQQIIQEYNSLPETGLLSPGAGATQRYALIDKANAALRAIGAEPIDRNSAGAVEAINKGTFSLGATLANSIGTREPGYIVSQAVKNSPGIEMSKKGFELVSSGLKQNAEYSNDRARFFRDYLSKFQHLDGAQEAFDHANPPEMYAKRAILTTIPADEKNRFVEFVRKNGEKYPNETRTTIQNFEREHSKGSAALVLGR